MVINYHNLCLGCMEEKTEALQCPHCGRMEGDAPESALHLPPGTILQEKYLIGKALGQGGFGITCLAWDMNLNLKLAIKEYLPQELAYRTGGQSEVSIYKKSLADNFNYGLEKFLEEARTLARFNEHPNIVSVRDFFKANGTAYLVMNYIEGVTLKEYLESRKEPLLFEQALDIFMPVLDALNEVHAAGILHRDISPDNLLIDTKGRVVLIDFGAARQAMGDKSRSMSVIMKAGYSPEEQYRSRGELGPWTDIYALAATFYQLITGLLPPESLDRLVDDTIVGPSQLGIAIDSASEQALLKALAVRYKDRYQLVEEFQDSLARNINFNKNKLKAEENKAVQEDGLKGKHSISKQAGKEKPIKNKKFTTEIIFAVTIIVGVLLAYGIEYFELIDRNNVEDMSWRGGTYSGAVDNNTPHGQGAWLHEDGIKYEGDYKDGERHGMGTMVYSDGVEYEGEWENGREHGKGTLIFPSGTKYEGEFKKGERHGKGTIVSSEGAKYTGEWENNKPHGMGTEILPDGTKYEGEFEDGKRHGTLTVVYANGDKYEGEYKDGNRHDQGTYDFANGDKYVGEFKDGKRHGQGTYHFASGNVESGKWEYGEYVGQ